MYQQQRDRVRTFRARVQEVDVEVFDRSGVLGVFVYIALHGEPVEVVYPGVVETLRPFVGRAYLSELPAKDRILGVRHTITRPRISNNWPSWKSCVF